MQAKPYLVLVIDQKQRPRRLPAIVHWQYLAHKTLPKVSRQCTLGLPDGFSSHHIEMRGRSPVAVMSISHYGDYGLC